MRDTSAIIHIRSLDSYPRFGLSKYEKTRRDALSHETHKWGSHFILQFKADFTLWQKGFRSLGKY